MQRESKAPMTTDYHAELLPKFGNLSLRNPIGNLSSSTYNVDASGSPYRCHFNAVQPPLHRGPLPFTKPPPMISPAYYRPYNGHMSLPQAPYGPQHQASRIEIKTASNELACIVEDLRRSGSMVLIEKLVGVLASAEFLLSCYACDKSGSLALQKLIKMIHSSGIGVALTRALARGFPSVACNGSGRHVIKECFKELSFAENEALSEAMILHFVKLATDEYGCICLNDCIPLMESRFKDQALTTIVANCSYLARDYYGTHVVQNAITRKHPFHTPRIVEWLRGDIVSLATQKEGSHLVERCFGLSSTKKIVLEELLRLSKQDMLVLACHEFGNFVVQSALTSTLDEVSPDVQQLARQLRRLVLEIQGELKLHPIGKNVYKKSKTKGHRRLLSTGSGESGRFNVS